MVSVGVWAPTSKGRVYWDQKHTNAFSKIATCQKLQVVKIMKSKRRPLADGLIEPWLNYSIRSMSNSGRALRTHGICIIQKIREKKCKWAGHLARFGVAPREQHILKPLVAWRCWRWWLTQLLYNDLNWSPIKHCPMIGQPRRWE